MDDWTPEMDEAFNEIEKQSNLGKQILQEINDDWRKHASEYERGFIDGMQKQMQSSVDKAVNAMAKREWIGLTYEDMIEVWNKLYKERTDVMPLPTTFAKAIEAKLKQKNGYAEEKNTPQPAAQDNAFEELAKAVREYATEQRAIEAKLKQKNGYAEEKNT